VSKAKRPGKENLQRVKKIHSIFPENKRHHPMNAKGDEMSAVYFCSKTKDLFIT